MDKKMKKNGFLRFCACLSAAAFLALGLPAAASPLAAYAAEEGGRRVFDEADLFTDQEEEQLEDSLLTAREETGMDLVIATCLDADGKSGQEYANDFYDMGGFGTGDDHSGALFLIDMDNRQYYIDAAAAAQEIYTDMEQEDILDELEDDMVEGDYYSACRNFLRCAQSYGTNDEVALDGYYDEATDTFVEYSRKEQQANERAARLRKVFSLGGILKRLGISLVIGAAGVGLMIFSVRSRRSPGGRVYLKPGSDRILARRDHHTNTTVTTRHIPKNNGGGHGGGGGHTSSHTSSGGHSHSGSGRGF